MTTFQTTTIPTKSWGFGIRDTQMTYPLERCFGLVCGEQGTGKSYCFQRNPRAAIFNTDVSGTVVPNPAAEIWPGVNNMGQPIDALKRPLRLSWKLILEQQQKLIQLAKDNQPRPVLVVIDTLEPLIAHLKDHITESLNRESFESIDSKLAWGRLQAALFPFFNELRDHGYGVWLIAHTFMKTIKVQGEAQTTERVALAVAPSISDFIYRTVEMVIPIKCTSETESKTVPVVTKVAGVGDVTEKKTIQVPFLKRVAAFDDPSVFGLRRTRTLNPMPSVRLDNVPDPWAAIEAAYNAANTVSPAPL